MGLWIKANGTEQEVKPANGKKFKLEELQKFVGGYIELTYTTKPRKPMYVNEEGWLRDLPVNFKASTLIDPRYLVLNFIRGDVIVCDKGEG